LKLKETAIDLANDVPGEAGLVMRGGDIQEEGELEWRKSHEELACWRGKGGILKRRERVSKLDWAKEKILYRRKFERRITISNTTYVNETKIGAPRQSTRLSFWKSPVKRLHKRKKKKTVGVEDYF